MVTLANPCRARGAPAKHAEVIVPAETRGLQEGCSNSSAQTAGAEILEHPASASRYLITYLWLNYSGFGERKSEEELRVPYREHFITLQGSKHCTDGMFKYWGNLRIAAESDVGAICFALLHRLYFFFCMVTYFSTCAFYFSVVRMHLFSDFISCFGHFLYTLFHSLFISGFHVLYMCI